MSDANTSPSLPPTPGGPSPASRSGCDKLLLGCGLGCGVLVLTFGVFAVFAGLWATRPGTQHETTAVVSGDGVAVMKLRDIGQDPGTQQFLTNFIRTMNDANREVKRQQLPENLRWLADMQSNNASPAGLNMFLPKDLTVSIEPRDPGELAAIARPDEDDELAFVAAVNFRSFVRPIRSLITWAVKQEAKEPVRRHGDHDLLPMGDDDWATFVDGTFVLSNSYAALVASLDRLDRGTIERAWSGEVPQGDWDFFGVVNQGTDAMQPVFAKIRRKNAALAADAARLEAPDATAQPEVAVRPEVSGRVVEMPLQSEDVEQLAFGIDLESADALKAELLYTLASDQAAADYAAYLAGEMEQVRIRGESEGLQVETTVTQDAQRVSATLAVSGLEDKVADMADWLVNLGDEAGRQIEEVVEEAARAAEEAAADREAAAGDDARP